MKAVPGVSDLYTREEIERVFRNSVSDVDYKRILALEPPVSAGIHKRIITTVFTDIRGATALEWEHGIEGSSHIVIEMLEAIREESTARGGYIAKFIADGSLILFGAPMDMEPAMQAKAAVETGLAIQKRAEANGVKIGIGISTGSASVGCLAPRCMPEYSPMGDSVNFASKLESCSKMTGDRLTIGVTTRDLVEPQFRTVLADVISVRGKEGLTSAEVFAIVGIRATMTTDESAEWDRYDAANKAVSERCFDSSIAELQSLAVEHPQDTLFTYASKRAQRLYASGLGEEFAMAADTAELAEKLSAACGRIFGKIDIALVEPGIDGLWRFRDSYPFASRAQILSPDGDALVWLRGLLNPMPVPVEFAFSALGFSMAAPVRVRNELAAALLVGDSARTDPTALGMIAESFADPWAERRYAETRELYREKVDDATKLEEVNRELEANSMALQKALDEIRTMNETLEARIADAASKLERASSLKRYLPPRVVEDILEGRRALAPRTERRKITVLFSDVRGFTSATDGLEPEELAGLLDEYLSSMSDIAFSAGATIDKFRGDGMMMFFGAPEPMEAGEGARRCIRMAVAMCQRVEQIREAWFDRGYDWDLGVRMGINTGYATVGEFGSRDRMDYTAIGSEVNLASRLEGCCETDSIVVSHATWALVRDEFPCKDLGEIEVKGIHKPVRLYRVDWRS